MSCHYKYPTYKIHSHSLGIPAMDLTSDNLSGQYLIHLTPTFTQQQQQHQKNWKLPDKILQIGKHLGWSRIFPPIVS